jgi:hypothetical protein
MLQQTLLLDCVLAADAKVASRVHVQWINFTAYDDILEKCSLSEIGFYFGHPFHTKKAYTCFIS